MARKSAKAGTAGTDFCAHGDVIKWKHSPRYRPFVRGIHQSLVNSPNKGQWRGALICAWTNDWVNNRGTSDLRRHRAHYDDNVMTYLWGTHIPVSKFRINIFRSDGQVEFELYDHFRCLQVIYSKYNYIYYVLSYSVDFKAHRELWNPLNKVVHVPGKCHGSSGHSKRNCLQDRANFHRSRAWRGTARNWFKKNSNISIDRYCLWHHLNFVMKYT